MMVRTMFDPFTGKRYDYSTSPVEEHLLKVLEAACGDDCPPEGEEYLCDLVDAPEGTEAEVCAKCFKNWADKAGMPASPKAKRLMQAIDLAVHDKCPPDTKDYLCQASEDESTDAETCCRCLVRWATLQFGQDRA